MRGRYMISRPPMFTDGSEALGSPVPMFKGVGNEWLPTLGVSWQGPPGSVSAGMPTATRPPSDSSSLMPAPPAIVMGLVLKMAWPRATDARNSWDGSPDQAL